MSINNLYPSTSPYFLTDIINNKSLDILFFRPIPFYSTDVLYSIPTVYQYRPDLLAYDLYGDARLWWVFAQRNPNELGPDPYFNFVTGLNIYIPKLETLRQTLGI